MRILATERLYLRTIEAGDAGFYLALVNDPSWIANIGERHIHSLEAAREAILAGPCEKQRTLGFSLYLVERRSDLAAMGLCGLIRRDTLPEVDIGYAMLPPFWGHGYAYEAAAAVVEHARRDLGLKRLLGITSPDNHSSNKLLAKLGLKFNKLVYLGPDDRGTNLYSLDFPALK
ncbi:MAG TPA: GNAT family N-acetyltransferase [Janthinobacterium sp.]|nr:GNAT family N-acetyltransferase [Janthinobacterium sp.]